MLISPFMNFLLMSFPNFSVNFWSFLSLILKDLHTFGILALYLLQYLFPGSDLYFDFNYGNYCYKKVFKK